MDNEKKRNFVYFTVKFYDVAKKKRRKHFTEKGVFIIYTAWDSRKLHTNILMGASKCIFIEWL